MIRMKNADDKVRCAGLLGLPQRRNHNYYGGMVHSNIREGFIATGVH